MRYLLPLLVLFPLSAHAAPLDEFQARAQTAYLVPFARDLGGLLGATGFHNGRSLGFPGFELGVVGAAQRRPDDDNRILRDAGVKGFGLPLLHVAVGLPFHIDVVGHGLRASDIGIVGGGLRYGILKSGVATPFIPNIGVSAFADKVDHDAFNARHYALNLNVGWNLPIIQPYFGLGADWTRLRAEAATAAGVVGQTAWARGGRFTVGADVTPFPFLKLKLALLNLHGVPGAEVALGAKF